MNWPVGGGDQGQASARLRAAGGVGTALRPTGFFAHLLRHRPSPI